MHARKETAAPPEIITLASLDGDESITDDTDSDSHESYVPPQSCRRNPHRAARDPSLARGIVYVPPIIALTERERTLIRRLRAEHFKRRQTEANVARLRARYEPTRGSLDEARVERARVLSERHEALTTAAGAVSPVVLS